MMITFLFFMLISTFYRVILKLFFRVGVKTDGTINKRILVIGTDEEAVIIAGKLKSHKTDVHSLIGLIARTHSGVGKEINGFKVIGSLENLNKVITNQKINEVIFSSEELSYSEMMSLVSASKNNSVDYKIVGSDLNFVVGKTSVSMLDDIPLVEVHYNISSPAVRIAKSLFDYSLGLIVLFSIYPFIYFFSKLSHKKSDFKKFILGIPSVLSGKMSFVGPKRIDNDKSKYFGKSGLTGLWYIEYCDESEFEKLDFYYAKNQNMWLDLEIIGKSLNKMWSKQT